MKQKHFEALLIVGAVLAVLFFIWLRLRSNSTAAASPAQVVQAATGLAPSGVVNVNFQGQPTTSGIATYIPLFGFLRFGAFGSA